MTISLRLARLLIVAITTAGSASAAERALHIAATSELDLCLPEIERTFERLHPGFAIETSFGPSENLVAQVRKGAPADVVLAAESNSPATLVKEGLAQADSMMHYASGHIALWSTQALPELNSGLMILARPKFRRIAMANPDRSPYGQAAQRALEAAGIWSAIDHKIVLGGDNAQTVELVKNGKADIAIITLASLKQPALNGSRYFEIPQHYYPAIKQHAVITKRGAGVKAARQFITFLGAREAQAVLTRCGLSR